VKIIFREFLGFEPEWISAAPDLKSMLTTADAALIIGDPAMKIPRDQLRVFDLATLWHEFTGFGFVFAMWMVRNDSFEKVRSVDFAAARDEGLANLDRVIADYPHQIELSREEINQYLTGNIVLRADEQMWNGLVLYLELAAKHKLIEYAKPLKFSR